MSLKHKNKGFTLIELLVVIAIIGILASVVLASLNTARNKAADAAVKANLASIGVQAEIYYDSQTPNTYGAGISSCTAASMFTDPNITNMIAQATAQLGTSPTVSCATDANGTKWAVLAKPLKSANTVWCVDNSGHNSAYVSGTTQFSAVTNGVCS